VDAIHQEAEALMALGELPLGLLLQQTHA